MCVCVDTRRHYLDAFMHSRTENSGICKYTVNWCKCQGWELQPTATKYYDKVLRTNPDSLVDRRHLILLILFTLLAGMSSVKNANW